MQKLVLDPCFKIVAHRLPRLKGVLLDHGDVQAMFTLLVCLIYSFGIVIKNLDVQRAAHAIA